jgi:hypothetical protein
MNHQSAFKFRSLTILAVTAVTIVMASLSFSSVPASAELFDLVIYGHVYDSNGDPIEGADVLVENMDTVCTPLTDITDSLGRYDVSFNANDWVEGDTIKTTATYEGTPESATGVADELATLEIDIHFTTAIPEFGSLTGVLVTMGIVGVIATVSMRRKKA